jgi:hypothetical protein
VVTWDDEAVWVPALGTAVDVPGLALVADPAMQQILAAENFNEDSEEKTAMAKKSCVVCAHDDPHIDPEGCTHKNCECMTAVYA